MYVLSSRENAQTQLCLCPTWSPPSSDSLSNYSTSSSPDDCYFTPTSNFQHLTDLID